MSADRAADTLRPATLELAEFISGLRPADVPQQVREVLQAAALDAIGCGLYGLTTEAGRIMLDFAAMQGGPEDTTLWASGGRKISAMNAALAMGTAIHAFDFDDHSRAKIHPGAAVLPAVLALGEREKISEEVLLAALAAGYETMNRVSYAANPNASRMRGWHLTGTCGTFAAAAAAAVILGLDASTTASALGLAGTQSSGLWAFNADGAMSKRLHPGKAAQSGIMAAQLAAMGFEGPRYILESEDGGFLAASSDDVRIEEIGRGLGEVWHTTNTCFKPYSCCGSNHAAIDATLVLARKHGIRTNDVQKIVVGVSRVVERQTGFPYRKTTVLNAQMSIRYNIAVALADGTALVQQFTPERLDDPALDLLIAKINVEIDPDMDAVYPARYAGIVTIHTKDGRVVRERVDFSKGMPENPMGMDDIEQKFDSLTAASPAAPFANEIKAASLGLFTSNRLPRLSTLLGKVQLRPE